MSETSFHGRSSTQITLELAKLLGKLARKGAFLHVSGQNSSATRHYAVYSPHNDFQIPISSASGEVVKTAIASGMLIPGQEPCRWRLSAAGASAIRSVRCAGEAGAGPVKMKAESRPRRRRRRRRRPDEAHDAMPAGGQRQAKVPATAVSPQTTTFDAAESPLGWLRRRRGKDGRPMIGEMQYQAGERLREDFWLAQLTPNITSNWSMTSTARNKRRAVPRFTVEPGARAHAAQQRVRQALEAVGPELNGVLIDVCCHLKGLEVTEKAAGWPRRCGKVVLTLALDALARHYGLGTKDIASKAKGNKILHWGAKDYKPAIDDQSAES